MSSLEITPEMLKELQAKLRAQTNKWITVIIDRVKSDKSLSKDQKESVNRTKIYNIFSNITRDGFWRRIVYDAGINYLAEVQDETKNLLEKSASVLKKNDEIAA